jgi:hypothetical protein
MSAVTPSNGTCMRSLFSPRSFVRSFVKDARTGKAFKLKEVGCLFSRLFVRRSGHRCGCWFDVRSVFCTCNVRFRVEPNGWWPDCTYVFCCVLCQNIMIAHLIGDLVSSIINNVNIELIISFCPQKPEASPV